MVLPKKLNKTCGRRNIMMGIWWMTIFCVLFVIIELWARERYKDERHWFDKVEFAAENTNIDFLFIGTSRVYASIDQNIFANKVKELTNKPVTALNMGRGYTTIVEYYFAIRQFAEKYPDAIKKCVIFLESSEGLPDLRGWNSSWILPEVWAQYILPYLKTKDIVKLWSTKIPEQEKYNITTLWLTQGSRLLLFNWDIRKGILKSGVRVIEKTLTRLGVEDTSDENDEKIKMVLPGGEDMDKARRERARELAINIAKKDMLNQNSADWDNTVLKDIIALIKSYGGKVVIFDLPVCSVQAKPLQTEIRKQDKEAFIKISKKWGVPLLKVDIKLDDNDFPDLWHIRESRREEFSEKLAIEYVEKILLK